MTSLKRWLPSCILIMLFIPAAAMALNIENKLADPILEQQAVSIFRDIRCMVCAGESIADSRVDLAKDLRALVREKLSQGNSREQVLDYIALRYGDTVLMQPPLKPATYLLWFGPCIMLFCGALLLFRQLRRRG